MDDVKAIDGTNACVLSIVDSVVDIEPFSCAGQMCNSRISVWRYAACDHRWPIVRDAGQRQGASEGFLPTLRKAELHQRYVDGQK